jgi:outer membrane protein assembly factor BamD (BamD/ComL family)
MGKLTRCLAGAALLAAAQLAHAQAPPAAAPSWELTEGGRWQQVAGPAEATTQPTSDPTLERVEEMIQANQADAAHRIVVAWLRIHKDSPLRDRGIFLLGQANFGRGNRIMAFYNFDELLEKYPTSRYYYPALQRQYDIADQFLRGYKRKFLGMPMFGAKEEATEMLYRIQQRAPGSPLAEKSLLRVADYYYADAQFDLAADAYGAYIRGYPRSSYLPRVRLRQAFATLAQFRGLRFDATPVIDARQQLLDLAAIYPLIAEQENVEAIIQRIDAALSRKLLTTARFWSRSGKPEASAYYYKLLMNEYPGSPEAEQAQVEIARLPAAAVQKARPAARTAAN